MLRKMLQQNEDSQGRWREHRQDHGKRTGPGETATLLCLVRLSACYAHLVPKEFQLNLFFQLGPQFLKADS